MAGDPGMALLNGLIDRLWWADVEQQRREYDERQADLGDAASAAARDRYEAAVIDEARAIVAGEIEQAPSVEHLRIALERMDGAMPAPREEDGEAPF